MKDVGVLSRILDDSFVETNQYGRSRTKEEMIDLFRTFPIDALSTDTSDVRVSGNAAMVTGTQTEIRGSDREDMLFTRVYVYDGDAWKLFASSQFMDPRVG